MHALIIGGKRIAVADLPLVLVQSVALACEVTFPVLLEGAPTNPVGGPLFVAAVCKHLGVKVPETFGEYVACFDVEPEADEVH